MKNSGKETAKVQTPQWKLFLYGALGAIAPDVVSLYAKRWNAPHLTFNVSQYVIVTLVYMVLAGALATAVPRRRTLQTAMAVGLSTPVVVGLLGNLGRNLTEPVRGVNDLGTLTDLFILY